MAKFDFTKLVGKRISISNGGLVSAGLLEELYDDFLVLNPNYKDDSHKYSNIIISRDIVKSILVLK